MANHDYLQDPKTGKMAGSLAGARHVPTVPAAAPVAFIPEPGANPARVAHLAAAAAREIAREHQDIVSDLAVARLDGNAHFIVFSADGTPDRIVGIGTRDGLPARTVTRADAPGLFADLDAHAPYITAADDGMFSDERFHGGHVDAAPGEKVLSVLAQCGIDGCTYRTGPVGSYPSHQASPGCHYGGAVQHCMCSRCF